MKLQTVLPIYNSHYKFLPGFTTFILNGFIPTKKNTHANLNKCEIKLKQAIFSCISIQVQKMYIRYNKNVHFAKKKKKKVHMCKDQYIKCTCAHNINQKHIQVR